MSGNEKHLFSIFLFHSSGNLTNRIVWTLLTEVVIFVVTIVLAMVDSSEWSGIFFYLTIGSVIILNSMLLYYSYYLKKVILIRISFINLIVTFLINFQWPLVFTKIQCSVWLPNCLSNILELYFLAL